MNNAEKATDILTIQPKTNDAKPSEPSYDDAQPMTKPSLWLPSFLIGDVAVVFLGVASLICLVGLTRQFVLLWKAAQEMRVLQGMNKSFSRIPPDP